MDTFDFMVSDSFCAKTILKIEIFYRITENLDSRVANVPSLFDSCMMKVIYDRMLIEEITFFIVKLKTRHSF